MSLLLSPLKKTIEEPDPKMERIKELMAELQKGPCIARIKPETFSLPLPSFDWESFDDSHGKAFWRQVPTEKGRAVEFKVTADFDFGSHSHPIAEKLIILEGACLFGPGRMEYMETGDETRIPANVTHSMRALKAGRARVEWADLEADEIEITTT